MHHKIILATHNLGKIAEFEQLIQGSSIVLLAQSQYGVADIEETGRSFVENALLKARHAAQLTGMPVIADDSGLCVPALQGAPGIYSARYAGEHGNSAANIAKLLGALKQIPAEQRQAYFLCCLVYMDGPDDAQPIICQTQWRGSILLAVQGEHGFGYDPIFYVPEYHCSAAELSPAIKNRLSHRAQAFNQLKALLKI